MLTISLIVMMGIEISTILSIYLTYAVTKNNFKKTNDYVQILPTREYVLDHL